MHTLSPGDVVSFDAVKVKTKDYIYAQPEINLEQQVFMNKENSSLNVREALAFILSQAQNRFGKAALERVEEAFRTVVEPALFSKFLLPYQSANFYFPGLTAIPWHNPDDFESTKKLEQGFPIIKKELNYLLEGKKGFQPTLESHLAKGGQWNAFYLRVDNQRFKQNWELCPETINIIESISGLGEAAFVSALNPETHILPHCGPWNARITSHLGLIVPDGCEFRVADETRKWEEGKCLVFDESFEHEAFNRGKKTRFCLLVFLWHPELTPIEIITLKVAADLFSEILEVRLQIEQAFNELDEKKWWF